MSFLPKILGSIGSGGGSAVSGIFGMLKSKVTGR